MPKDQPTETTYCSERLAAADGSFEAVRCIMDLRADLCGSALAARVTLTLKCLKAVVALRFNLSRTFAIRGIESSRPVAGWRRRADTVTIILRERTRAGQRMRITFEYEGPIKVRCQYDQVLTAITPEGGILTELWFPWLFGLRARFAAALEVPRELSAVANAPLVGRAERGDTARITWESAGPLPGFEIAIGRYHTQKWLTERGRFCYHGYRKQPARAREMLRVFGGMLGLFQRRFGPLPYREFHLVEIPEYYRGGRGRAPMIWLAEPIFNSPLTPRFRRRFLAHEMAHFWWGNLVEGSGVGWLWLHEGFAAYSELLYLEADAGPEAYRAAVRGFARRFGRDSKRARERPLRSVGTNDPLCYPILYCKGAVALHRLREGIGDKAFFGALRLFCRRFGGGSATVDDFRECAEQLGRVDLRPFFRALLDDVGLPSRRLIKRA